MGSACCSAKFSALGLEILIDEGDIIQINLPLRLSNNLPLVDNLLDFRFYLDHFGLLTTGFRWQVNCYFLLFSQGKFHGQATFADSHHPFGR